MQDAVTREYLEITHPGACRMWGKTLRQDLSLGFAGRHGSAGCWDSGVRMQARRAKLDEGVQVFRSSNSQQGQLGGHCRLGAGPRPPFVTTDRSRRVASA